MTDSQKPRPTQTVEAALAGALEQALEQIEQMRGMFDDGDGQIEEALHEGRKALDLYAARNP
ncbi:hypothetical protein [Thioalkalivibrio thiocyanodenitrificans]|uniref:hypothetical protein n=1 Tax=Thioalkalivibrio thiocyanodenitrificans TaxID=243063 RepID=UPI00035C6DA3|nr:hypothetical protein [Thioalkalivibrio thiocyanodenitrificans]